MVLVQVRPTEQAAREPPPHLAAAILVEQKLSIQVALLLTEEVLQILVAPLERHVVHSNLQHKGKKDSVRCQLDLHQRARQASTS
jgi:hypothetical protein